MYAIKFNNCGSWAECHECGEGFDADVGFYITPHDTYDLLCHRCAMRKRPELACILRVLDDILGLGTSANGQPDLESYLQALDTLALRLKTAAAVCLREKQRLEREAAAAGKSLEPDREARMLRLARERASGRRRLEPDEAGRQAVLATIEQALSEFWLAEEADTKA